MDPEENLPDRYGFLVTLLLSVVAFQFVTILDQYILCSFCFLFMIMNMIGIIPIFGDRYINIFQMNQIQFHHGIEY